MSLSETERAVIEELIEGVQKLAEKIIEPVDPKVEGCLELAFRCLVEQIACDRRYEWEEIAPPDDKFLFLSNEKDNEIPDADELNNWMSGDSGETDA